MECHEVLDGFGKSLISDWARSKGDVVARESFLASSDERKRLHCSTRSRTECRCTFPQIQSLTLAIHVRCRSPGTTQVAISAISFFDSRPSGNLRKGHCTAEEFLAQTDPKTTLLMLSQTLHRIVTACYIMVTPDLKTPTQLVGV